MKRILISLIVLFSFSHVINSSEPDSIPDSKIIISGHVRDRSTGEMLAGVTVFETTLRKGAFTNNRGYYTITVPAGRYELQFSYIGYKTAMEEGNSDRDLTVDVSLEPAEMELGEVIVQGKREDNNVRAAAMSIVELDVRTIKSVPSLLGEIDLVKVIQLLPGVQSASEGSTGFSVRGGNTDQNLILLDDATIYNASHLMGFFSVFNNDVVSDVTLYKGDIPASYGGRISSLLDVQTKDGDPERFGLSGSIGTISSKLTVEGPLIRNRTTFLAGGRRTYADLFLPFARDEEVRDNKLYFYDINLKLTHIINSKNRLFFSYYKGQDVFRNEFSSIGFGNNTASLRWNHIVSDKIFMNLSFLHSGYNYNLESPETGSGSFRWTSEIKDYSSRLDFTHFVSEKHKIKYGVTLTWHKFYPGNVSGIGSLSGATEFSLASQSAIESGIYITDDFSVTDRLILKYGIRLGAFQNVGPGTVYNYDEGYNPEDSSVYRKGEIYNTFIVPEPRVAFTFLFNENSSVKGSYSLTAQYLTLAQNSTAGTPLDIWFTASPNVKPQICNQIAAGYFRNFRKNIFEVSAEVYYKKLSDLIDFRDHAILFLNPYLEGELRIGRGYSYGIETIIRKNDGRLSGWVSYTWSRSYRQVPEINGGRRYVSPYDKPHNLNIITSYRLSPRWEASATWVYATGIPVTFPTGRAVIANQVIPIYSDRNSYRMEAYHRLDLSVTLKSREKPGKRFRSELNLSVYNAYNRHNTWAINFVNDENDPNVIYAEKTYLFSIIPALTYNIKF